MYIVEVGTGYAIYLVLQLITYTTSPLYISTSTCNCSCLKPYIQKLIYVDGSFAIALKYITFQSYKNAPQLIYYFDIWYKYHNISCISYIFFNINQKMQKVLLICILHFTIVGLNVQVKLVVNTLFENYNYFQNR